MATGSLTLNDLREYRFASAATFGLDKINTILQADLNYFNSEMNEQMNYLATPTTVESVVWGSSATNKFTERDEFGRPITRMAPKGQTVSFPISTFVTGLGWTEDYLQMASPAEVAEDYLRVRRGYCEQQLYKIKRAILNNTNYDFVDPYKGITLGIKRLINADGSAIPDHNGVSFDGSSHTHYLARVSTLAVSDVDSLVSTVVEHGSKGVKIFINSADKAAFSALSKFTALSVNTLAYAGVTSTIQKLDIESDATNRMIGLWDSQFEVWIKNQMTPANYIMCVATGEVDKVLAFRQPVATSLQGLRIKPMFTSNTPMIAQEAEAIGDFGCNNRSAAAVLYIGGTSWANPTLTY